MRGLVALMMIAMLACLPAFAGTAWAQAQGPVLSGKVVSDREGPMEGVLVSARNIDSTITVTVVSDANGEYGFPGSRLEPGRYTLVIRAAGYALEARGMSISPKARQRLRTSSSFPPSRVPSRSPTPNG